MLPETANMEAKEASERAQAERERERERAMEEELAEKTPLEAKAIVVKRLLHAKAASAKTFTQIAQQTHLTNAYVGQLFHRQAQLHPSSVNCLREAVPTLSDELIQEMMTPPRRSFDPQLLQDPVVYRFYEAVMNYGETFKAIINEEFGDGIMSSVGFYCNVDKVEGKEGEKRVITTFNGKFFPFAVQHEEDNVKVISRE